MKKQKDIPVEALKEFVHGYDKPSVPLDPGDVLMIVVSGLAVVLVLGVFIAGVLL